jgi:hypothetical protein
VGRLEGRQMIEENFIAATCQRITLQGSGLSQCQTMRMSHHHLLQTVRAPVSAQEGVWSNPR